MNDEGQVDHFPNMEEDITWICDILRMRDLDDHRRKFLRRLDTLDVSACPGSGKTTLVVAKLALLARRWPWKARGICVLSHTNVAREEIEKRLGASVVGPGLSGYPHFIGTIHSFLSQFLVQPFLLSRGRAFQAFDDDLTERARRRVIGRHAKILCGFLEKKHTGISQLRIADAEFKLGSFPAGPHSDMYKLAERAVGGAAEQGYFCFDEIFPLAEAMLDARPDVAKFLSQRFPFVLMDEMQDTDERQGALLARIFPRDRADLSVQRVGDPNQGIFNGKDLGRDITFPDPDRRVTIADSFRFGPGIGALASPLAVAPVRPSGLQGVGPSRHGQLSPQPTIFLFHPEAPGAVLRAFGQVVLEAFPDPLLSHGSVVAVAAVHKDIDKPDAGKQPQTLGDYWPSYQRSHARKECHPATLGEYVLFAQRRAKVEGTMHGAVNDLAFGLLHMMRLDTGKNPGQRGRSHLRVQALLEPEEWGTYQTLVASLLTLQTQLDATSWGPCRSSFEALAKRLCGKDTLGKEASTFLNWPENPAPYPIGEAMPTGAVNTYRHEEGDRSVDIRLGSIHSVKGETHLATLVLETFHYKHVLTSLMDSLGGTPVKENASDQHKARARLTYVAMTRPTHLLCLAIPATALGEGDNAEQRTKELEAQGWRVVRVPRPD